MKEVKGDEHITAGGTGDGIMSRWWGESTAARFWSVDSRRRDAVHGDFGDIPDDDAWNLGVG